MKGGGDIVWGRRGYRGCGEGVEPRCVCCWKGRKVVFVFVVVVCVVFVILWIGCVAERSCFGFCCLGVFREPSVSVPVDCH